MNDRDRYLPGVPCWVDTSQPDPESAVGFYSGLFGWEFENVLPPDSPGKYFVARLDGGDVAAVGSQPEGAPPAAVWNTYVWVENADQTASKVRDAGGKVLTEPFDVMDAGRMAVFADPDGAAFCVWQPKDHRGAKLVNEPGSLNFNDLNTRDPEGAKRFYGQVFGWETLELPGGFAMWTLPGYGDFLEHINPGMRKRMAEVGAPPASRTWWRASTRFPTSSHRHASSLGSDVRRRRRRRDRHESRGARRAGARSAVRRSVGPDDDHLRPPGRDVHGEQVRPGEQGPREPVRSGSERVVVSRR